jgi:hypothetical protein
MPPVGKRSDVLRRAVTRLGAIDSKTLKPTVDAETDCLDAAIDWYDRIRPRTSVYEVAGDDVKRRFVLSTDVTGWAKGSSQAGPVQLVVSPDTNDEKIADLGLNDWDQRRSSAGDDILMLAATVPTGTTLRVHWNAAHIVDAVDGADTTIPERDADAFVSMIAAFLARWISRRASDVANANLGADQIDAEPIGERWAKRARELETQAMDRLAPKSDSVSAAGASVEWPNDNTTARQPRVGH